MIGHTINLFPRHDKGRRRIVLFINLRGDLRAWVSRDLGSAWLTNTDLECLARKAVSSFAPPEIVHLVVITFVALPLSSNLHPGAVVFEARVRIRSYQANVKFLASRGHTVSNDTSRSSEWSVSRVNLATAALLSGIYLSIYKSEWETSLGALRIT